MSGKSDIWLFDSFLHHTVMEAANFFFMLVKTLVEQGEDAAASTGQNYFHTHYRSQV